MEKPSPSKHIAALGSENALQSVRDGITMDGEWERQPVHRGAYECESI